MAAAREVGIEDLGLQDLEQQPYEVILGRMRALAGEVRADRSPGAVWLLEHEPVFTAGRATSGLDLTGPAPAAIVAIERGGRITYHGPGQLVVYPIVRLPRRDVRAWLRALEGFGVAICAEFGLEARASVDGTGVFVDGRKIASIGVAIRHWINLHGIAINVAMDLAPFRSIRPCGLDPEIMSDLTTAAGRPITLADARLAARRHLPDLLGACRP